MLINSSLPPWWRNPMVLYCMRGKGVLRLHEVGGGTTCQKIQSNYGLSAYHIAQNVGGVKLWRNHSTRVIGR